MDILFFLRKGNLVFNHSFWLDIVFKLNENILDLFICFSVERYFDEEIRLRKNVFQMKLLWLQVFNMS